MIVSDFYALLILARSAYEQHPWTAQNMWPVVFSLGWTRLLQDGRGRFMHNRRGKVSFVCMLPWCGGLTGCLDRFAFPELQVSSCRCARRGCAGGADLAGDFGGECRAEKAR